MDFQLASVWLIDDDPDAHFLLKRVFQRSGICSEPKSFLHPVQALEAFCNLCQLKQSAPELCVLDMSMPTYDGIQLMQLLHEIAIEHTYRPLYCLLLSNALPVNETDLLSQNRGLLAIREKPLNKEQLLAFMDNEWKKKS